MIKKCGQLDCSICRPPRLPYSVHFLPDPEPADDPDHYKTFDDLYGKETSEKDRPSITPAKLQNTCNFRVSGETVRATLICSECEKPRCVYARKVLTKDQVSVLENIAEEGYVCGENPFPDTCPLYEICYVTTDVNCEHGVSPHYFSARNKYPLVCYRCGDKDPKPIQADVKSQYQSVHPICETCSMQGYEERKRNKSKCVAKKQKTS